jgi:hypothetical protein
MNNFRTYQDNLPPTDPELQKVKNEQNVQSVPKPVSRQNSESRHTKTLTDSQVLPVGKLNNSLKMSKEEITANKTPNIKHKKAEKLTSLNDFTYPHPFSKSVKNKPASRNESMYAPNEEKNTSSKHSESLTDKFIRQSQDFSRKEQKKNDFSTLSFNSRKKKQSRDLKESVSAPHGDFM